MSRLINILVIPFSVALILLCNQTIAQTDLDFDEVQVIAPYEPAISDAFKISDSPVIKDTLEISRDLSYSIVPIKLQTSFEVEPISPARMRGEPLEKLYKGHAAGGFGTHTTPYGEFFYNTLRSNDYAYGLRLKHFSSKGSVKDKPYSGYSDNLINLHGKKFFRNHILDAGLDYKRNSLHFYGINEDDFTDDAEIFPIFDELTQKDELRQTYNYFSTNTGLRNSSLDSADVSYDMMLNYNYLMDDYDATQQNIKFSGSLQRQLLSDPIGISERQHFKLDALADYYINQSPTAQVSGSIFSLAPSLSSNFNIFDFYLGATITIQSDSITYGKIHPIAGTEITLIDKALAAYGYLSGGIKRHNLYNFYNRNPFINSDLEYHFMNTKSELGGGFRGSFSSYVSYDVRISNSNIENYAFFVTDYDTQLNNKLNVIYDDVSVFNFRTELYSQIGRKLNARFISNYYQFTLKNEMEAWHTPTFELNLSVKYNIEDKIILTGNGFARNSVFGKVYDDAGNPDKEEIHGFHVDVNFGIEYRYTKLLSVFLNFNNVQNQPLERWLNYPSQRFNFLGGISYSF